jgi:hypothetical protein
MVAVTALTEVLFSERYELHCLSFESVYVLILFLSLLVLAVQMKFHLLYKHLN